MSSRGILSIEIRYEQDVVLTRQRTRQIASLLGFSTQDQTSLATAVSEIARNAFRYAGNGRVEFLIDLDVQPQLFSIRVQDKGPGISNLGEILDGRYVSQTGMGLGIIGSKRLSDEFTIDATPGNGTTVVVGKRLSKRAPIITSQLLDKLSTDLAQRTPKNPLEEVQEQNKELMQALDDLRVRQAEVERLNTELAETNRGVVALYAELDDKAESLRKASEYKSRFLSDMTHELRTPLNAMISLSRLLLDRVDGDLMPEQEKQVSLIHKSAAALGEMVNDLLDIARIEAGKSDIQVTEFAISEVFAAVRGMFRPLVADGPVILHIAEPVGLSKMASDERKLSQILRNLVSNAVKFTETGEIRLNAEVKPDDQIAFTVADTGIGIDPENLDVVFEDFTQIDSSVQRRVRGTGLGLPLTRKLARLLGGDVTVESQLNVGSTFTVLLPLAISAPKREEVAVGETLDSELGGDRG